MYIYTRKRSRTTKKQILMKKMQSVKRKITILAAFLLITIALLIAVSIYCCLIKNKSKKKHLLPYCITNNKLNEVL